MAEGRKHIETSPIKRRTSQSKVKPLLVIAGSLGFHLLVVLFFRVPMPEPKQGRDDDLLSMTFSCDADAALAASAAAALCLAPGQDAKNCLGEVQGLLDDLLAECNAVDVSFVDISEIKPKPLVPLVDPVEDKVAAKLLEEDADKKLAEVKKEIEKKNVDAQVVEITEPENQMRPEEARFVSEFDSKVKKETVARGTTEKMVSRPSQAKKIAKIIPDRVNTPSSSRIGPQAPQNASPDSSEPSPQPPNSPKKLAMRDLPTGKGPDLGFDPSDLGSLPAFTENPGLQKREEVLADSSKGETSGAKTLPFGKPLQLMPSEEVLSKVAGGGSVDKLDGVEDGDTTSLNSKQWKHALFFNRLKRQVAQNWNPGAVYARRDPRGNIYGSKDRTTVVKVFLTKDGRLARVHVEGASGVDFLDEEAVRAFRQASPFPNPPRALVEGESELISFVFGFHFQVGERSGWKIFRRR